MAKADKEVMFSDGNGEFRKMTPELKKQFENVADFLHEYGFSMIPKNEEYREENKRNNAAYHFKNTFSVHLLLLVIWTIACIICVHIGLNAAAYLFLGCVLLVVLSLYFSFKSFNNTS